MRFCKIRYTLHHPSFDVHHFTLFIKNAWYQRRLHYVGR